MGRDTMGWDKATVPAHTSLTGRGRTGTKHPSQSAPAPRPDDHVYGPWDNDSVEDA